MKPQQAEDLEQIDTRVRRAGEWRQRIAQHPWKWLGRAIAAGFVLGRRRPKQLALEHAGQSFADAHPAGHGERRALTSMGGPVAAVLCYKVLRPYIQRQARQLTTAPDASWSTGAGAQALGFDSPPIESSYLSNPEVAEGELDHKE